MAGVTIEKGRYFSGIIFQERPLWFTLWFPFATAILDRLLHRCTTLNIKGESYRLKDKRKAGIFGPPRSQEVKQEEEPEPEFE